MDGAGPSVGSAGLLELVVVPEILDLVATLLHGLQSNVGGIAVAVNRSAFSRAIFPLTKLYLQQSSRRQSFFPSMYPFAEKPRIWPANLTLYVEASNRSMNPIPLYLARSLS